MGLGSKIKSKLTSVAGGGDAPAAAPPTQPGQKPSQRAIYQNRYNHGPNFGGMFVLEKWIAGNMFTDKAKGGSELDAVKALVDEHGKDGARQKFEEHWRSWISDDDWNWLKSKRVTAVRVPVGYWDVNGGAFTHGTDFEKYKDVYKNAWTIFKEVVIDKAAQYNIGVLVDMHGLPGGANGEEHSGTSNGKANLWTSSSYRHLSVEVAQYIAGDIKSKDNVVGLQIVNEATHGDMSQKWTYYGEALRAIREVNPDIPVVISDGWDPSGWIDFLRHKEMKLGKGKTLGVELDTHVYRCFSDADKSKAANQHADEAADAVPDAADADLIVGEYSCVLDEQSWKHGGDRHEIVKRFGNKQMDGFHRTARAGVYFWTYKFAWGGGGEWSFREMTESGSIWDFSRQKYNPLDQANSKFQEAFDRARGEHVGYWDSQGKQDWEHWRYEDGFKQGWQDAAAFYEFDGSELGRLAGWRKSRLAEHIQARGDSDKTWAFEHGFNKAVDAFFDAAHM